MIICSRVKIAFCLGTLGICLVLGERSSTAGLISLPGILKRRPPVISNTVPPHLRSLPPDSAVRVVSPHEIVGGAAPSTKGIVHRVAGPKKNVSFVGATHVQPYELGTPPNTLKPGQDGAYFMPTDQPEKPVGLMQKSNTSPKVDGFR